jgi:hypothetical protein
MHDLEPGFFKLGSLPIYSYTLRSSAEAFFVFPLVFQRAVAIPSKFTRRGSPVGFISFDKLGERKVFDRVIADHAKFLADSVACASRSRWRQKVRHQGCLVGIRNDVRPAAITPQGNVLASLSVPNDWVFRRRNKRLAGSQAPYFCASCATTHARGGRQACGSFERLTTGGWCAQESCHSPVEARRSAGLGSQKSAPSKHICPLCTCGWFASQIHLFSHLEIWDWISGVQVLNRAILERETCSSAKSNPLLGRWNAGGTGSRSNPKKLDWPCDLEGSVEML